MASNFETGHNKMWQTLAFAAERFPSRDKK